VRYKSSIGSRHWLDPSTGHYKPVGCGKMAVEPATSQTEFWYFPDSSLPDKAFTQTSPNNGTYLVCGLLENKEYTFKLLVDDQEIAQDC
jgi:hypothetical protein